MCYGGDFEEEHLEEALQRIDTSLEEPSLWEDRERATALLQKKSYFQRRRDIQMQLEMTQSSLEAYLYFANEGDEEAIVCFVESITKAWNDITAIESAMLFIHDEDICSALVELHAGAGGKDAQDWTEMLSRMYSRFAIQKGYSITCIDYIAGDEAGIKSITLQIDGEYAFGFLQYERGIHRLIRISPFDSSGKRHTSFASVDVLPVIEENKDIVIKDCDIRVDTFRSSGPGGQSVNTTSSAVRITHIPTGIVVQCQNERSQHANKESALNILKARLYRMEQEKMQAQKQSSYNTKDAINFGSQIRTYTLHPYMLVKDHRTQMENSNVEGVLGGDILPFLQSSLQFYAEYVDKEVLE